MAGELLVRRNAIRAKAIAARVVINKQAQVKVFKNRVDDINAELVGLTEGSKKELELRKAAIRARRNLELQAENLTQAERKRIIAQANKDIADADNEALKKKLTKILDIASQIGDVASKAIEAQITQQTKALDDQQKATLNNALLTADQRTAIEKDFQKKREALEREAAEKRKKFALVEAVINAAKGITAAIPNVPLMILAGVLGAAQIAIVAA